LFVTPKANTFIQAFRQLPAAQLTHPLFVQDGQSTLSVPTFSPVCRSRRCPLACDLIHSQDTVNKHMIGKVVAFSLTDNGPVQIFGLPKTVLLEVCVHLWSQISTNTTAQFRVLSKPCSVIRDVTLQIVELMKSAQDKSSRDTRSVLSTVL
jgi:small subunit ribosomal protein S29